MTLGSAAFAPLTETETAEASKPKKKAEKTPIIPVPDDAEECTFKHPQYGRPVTKWAYRDGSGALLGYDARFEWEENGKRQKEVLPLCFCDLGDGKRAWRQKAFPAPKPLFGLDQLAARSSAPVVIAEGVKSTEAAARLLPDHVGVSWQGGTNAVGQSGWHVLKGRDILVWPDRDRHCTLTGEEKPYEDQVGTIAAENIIERLKPIANSIRVLDLADIECKDGWDAADAEADGSTPADASTFVERYSVEVDAQAPGVKMPMRFEDAPDGLHYVESESNRLRICGRIKVLAKTRDPNGSSWGLLLEWRDDDGTSHRWSMARSMLAGDGGTVRETLLDRGLFVSTDAKARSQLLVFLSSVDTSVRARAVSKVGWAGDAFALPHITVGDSPTDRVIFQHPDVLSHQYQSAGTLEEWQQNVARLAVGNSRLAFMMSAAFVGPILAPACEEGGGANVVGPSSCGKTTALAAAASTWGPESFVRAWRATGNGLEGVAAQHSETLLCLDELAQLDAREAGQVAYMLGNGQGKTRASRSGGSRAASTWKVMFLSTGEVGIADLVREGKPGQTAQAGQEVRILDVPADAGKGMGIFENLHGAESPEAFSRQVKVAAKTHYGTAAMAFLERLAPVKANVGESISASVNDFLDKHVPAGADGQVLRAARRFGLVAAAGELAIALGVLPWQSGEASGASAVMFRAWVDRRGGVGSAEDRNIIERFRAFLEAHGESRFSPHDTEDVAVIRAVINRAGFYRTFNDGNGEQIREYWVLPEAFKEICRGFEPTQVAKVLKAVGALKASKEGKNTDNRRLPGLGQKRVYVIGPEIFHGD
jgi:uncharacterized protein (DUF927 family)